MTENVGWVGLALGTAGFFALTSLATGAATIGVSADIVSWLSWSVDTWILYWKWTRCLTALYRWNIYTHVCARIKFSYGGETTRTVDDRWWWNVYGTVYCYFFVAFFYQMFFCGSRTNGCMAHFRFGLKWILNSWGSGDVFLMTRPHLINSWCEKHVSYWFGMGHFKDTILNEFGRPDLILYPDGHNLNLRYLTDLERFLMFCFIEWIFK